MDELGSIRLELQSRDILNRILCGGVAGIVAKTVIAPAERVKMSFQVALPMSLIHVVEGHLLCSCTYML